MTIVFFFKDTNNLLFILYKIITSILGCDLPLGKLGPQRLKMINNNQHHSFLQTYCHDHV
jgi:hypothetical protein